MKDMKMLYGLIALIALFGCQPTEDEEFDLDEMVLAEEVDIERDNLAQLEAELPHEQLIVEESPFQNQ